jgi:hypothetical protein
MDANETKLEHFKFLPGDIGFSMDHGNTISKIFKWAMSSKWSHSFLIQEQTPTRIYTSETSSFEVQLHCLESYIQNPNYEFEIWRHTGLTDQDRRRVADLAVAKTLGETYGYLQLFSLGLRIILRKFRIRMTNFIRQGIVCCGHVATGYHLAQIPGWVDVDPENIDTEEMYQSLPYLGFERVAVKLRSKN